MCHRRTDNSKIERYLRTIYKDKQYSFKEILEKDSSVSFYEKNVQILATEM